MSEKKRKANEELTAAKRPKADDNAEAIPTNDNPNKPKKATIRAQVSLKQTINAKVLEDIWPSIFVVFLKLKEQAKALKELAQLAPLLKSMAQPNVNETEDISIMQKDNVLQENVSDDLCDVSDLIETNESGNLLTLNIFC
jgi:hypothetical protein